MHPQTQPPGKMTSILEDRLLHVFEISENAGAGIAPGQLFPIHASDDCPSQSKLFCEIDYSLT